MRNLRTTLSLLAVATLAAPVYAATPSPACVSQGSNARVTWTAPAAEPIRAARAYFRADAATAEHYVEMRRSGDAFIGILPKAAVASGSIEYRIATSDADGKFVTRGEGRIAVSDSCAATKLEVSEAKVARTLIIGSTTDTSALPAGFRCDGIIGRITKGGELKSFAACAETANTANTQVADAATATSAQSTATPATAAKSASARAPRVVTDTDTVVNASNLPDRRDPRPVSPTIPRGGP